MNIKKLIITTLAIWIVSAAYTMLTCGWLFSWVYELPPMIWKTPTEIMASANMIGSYLAGVLVSFLFVFIFAFLYKKLPNKGVKRGLLYGFLVWLVGPASGVIAMPFYMTIATIVVAYWVLSMLVKYLLLGAIVGVLYKTK